jgi:glycosyltransferase involved in cell wall biosynthesis
VSTPLRVAHLVSHPIPYFAPLYRELSGRAEIDLTVFFLSDKSVGEHFDPEFGRTIAWDVPLLAGYQSRFLSHSEQENPLRHALTSLRVARTLSSGEFDIVWAHGYNQPAVWLMGLRRGRNATPLLIREEAHLLRDRSLVRRALKELPTRRLLSRAYGLYIGERNRAFFERYGTPEASLFRAPYCVDNDAWQNSAADLAPRRHELRSSFGITDDAPVLLYCGKLIPKKQPAMLVNAFAELSSKGKAWLLLVGDGALRGDLESLIADAGLERVILTGFLNQTEVPRAYVAADVFVLPSRGEPWGLVVNEAMNFGLPVVVSDRVGCAPDLVHDGENGFVFPRDDGAALTLALERLVGEPALRRRFGERSRAIVGEYSIEVCADGIVAACQEIARRAGSS